MKEIQGGIKMKYFTKKEILESFKTILEGMDESKLDITKLDGNNPNCVSGIFANQFSYDNSYINDEAEAKKALKEYWDEPQNLAPFELIDALQEGSYFYGGKWDSRRIATELEIALASIVQQELLPLRQRFTFTKQIALDKVSKALKNIKDDEIVIFKK